MRAFLALCALLCVWATVSGEPAVLHPGPAMARTSGEVLLELAAREGFAAGDYVPQPGRVVTMEFLAGHDGESTADVTTVEDKGGRVGYVNEFNFHTVSANALRRVYRARLNLPTTGVRAADLRVRLTEDQDDVAKMAAIVEKYPLKETADAIAGGKLDQFLEKIRGADDETLRSALLDRLERVVERIRDEDTRTHLDSDVLARAVSILETQLDKEEEVVEQEGPRVAFVRRVVRGEYEAVEVEDDEQTLNNNDHLQNLFAEARSGGERVLGTFNVRDLSVTSRTRHDFVKLAYVIARNLPDMLVVQEVRDGLGERFDDVYHSALEAMQEWHEGQYDHHTAQGNPIAGAHQQEAEDLEGLRASIADPTQPCATNAQFDTLKEIHHEFASHKHLHIADTNMRKGGSIATLVYHINHLLGVNAYTGVTTEAVETGQRAKPEGYGVIWRRDRATLDGVGVDDEDDTDDDDDEAARAPDRMAACFHANFGGTVVPVCTSHLHFGTAYDNADDVEIREKELLRMRDFADGVGTELGTEEYVLLGDFNLPPAWVAATVTDSDRPEYDTPAEDVDNMLLAVSEWAHSTTVGDVSSFDNVFATNALGLHVEGVPSLVARSRFGWIDTFDDDLYAHPKRSLAEAAGCLPHEQACRVNHAERDELHCPAHCDLIWADFDNEEKRVNQLARKQVSDHRPVFTTLAAGE